MSSIITTSARPWFCWLFLDHKCLERHFEDDPGSLPRRRLNLAVSADFLHSARHVFQTISRGKTCRIVRQVLTGNIGFKPPAIVFNNQFEGVDAHRKADRSEER